MYWIDFERLFCDVARYVVIFRIAVEVVHAIEVEEDRLALGDLHRLVLVDRKDAEQGALLAGHPVAVGVVVRVLDADFFEQQANRLRTLSDVETGHARGLSVTLTLL